MKIVVISMKTSNARRQAAKAQLDRLDLDFEFFDALRGDIAMQDCFDSYDEYRFLLNTGRTATVAEIGCFASHRALWELCMDTGQAFMIMEDDFLADKAFATAVQLVAENIEECGFIRLQSETRAKKRLEKSLGEFQLWRFTKVPHSTMCYGISPSVAKTLFATSAVVTAPIDVFLKKFWEHGQPMFGLSPYTVTESQDSNVSTIQRVEKPNKPLKIKVLRVITKCGWFLGRVRFNFRVNRRG